MSFKLCFCKLESTHDSPDLYPTSLSLPPKQQDKQKIKPLQSMVKASSAYSANFMTIALLRVDYATDVDDA